MGHSIQTLFDEHVLLHDFHFEIIGGAIISALSEFQRTSAKPLDDSAAGALVELWTPALEMPINGCVDLKLEQLVQSKGTLSSLIALNALAKARLLGKKDAITEDQLNEVLIFKTEIPNGFIPRAKIEKAFDRFDAFLRSALKNTG